MMLLAWLFLCVGLVLLMFALYKFYTKRVLLAQIFSNKKESLLQQKKQKELLLRLESAGVGLQEYRLLQILAAITGVAVAILPFLLGAALLFKVVVLFIGIAIALLTPKLFIEEQRKKRIARIDADLAIFLDLLVIILQAGGGLLNAIDVVTKEAEGIIGKDLLEETKKFKKELTTLSPSLAYENLIRRTGSENVASIVSFMRISEESGIGLKTIFENQSKEIKEKAFFEIEKRASLLNIKMILAVFVFVLPALGAFIILPMMDNALVPEAHRLLGK